VLLPFGSFAATPWSLITPEEDARDRAAPQTAEPNEPQLAGDPAIELLARDLSRPVHNPVTVDVRINTQPDTRADMRTLRVRYGWLRIDITNRILRHATVTANRVTATDVDIPRGRHRLTVSVADTDGRTGSRQFTVSIAG
jgi:hypothetical protein